MRRALLALAAMLGLGVALLHSVTTAVAWWREEIDPGWWEWMWIALLPVWLFVFLRYFSIFRPGADACVPSDAKKLRHPGP
jgi:hypothetical protein